MICIGLMLKTLLNTVNGAVCIAERSDDRTSVSRLYAYGATKGLQSIDSIIMTRSGELFVPPPMPPRLSLQALEKASAVTLLQLYFIVAHELAHIALGHLDEPVDTETERRTQELAADAGAAGVLLARFEGTGALATSKRIELAVGQIGAVFWAGEAIFDLSARYHNQTYDYPDANDRLAAVIDCWRERLKLPDIMGSDLFMRPYALLSHVVKLVRTNAYDAIMFLTDIASECRAIQDYTQEVYTLAFARDVAREAGMVPLSMQIATYVERVRGEEGIVIPIRELM